jgi:hypothetical protein
MTNTPGGRRHGWWPRRRRKGLASPGARQERARMAARRRPAPCSSPSGCSPRAWTHHSSTAPMGGPADPQAVVDAAGVVMTFTLDVRLS